MRGSEDLAIYVWHGLRVVVDIDGRDGRFAVLDRQLAVNLDGVSDREGMAIDVDCDVFARRDVEAVACRKVVADNIDFVASADGSIDVVLNIVIINIAADDCLRVGKVRALERDTLAGIVVWALVYEWEVVDLFVVEGFAVERGIVVAAVESNLAFDIAVVVVEGAVLLHASGRAFDADVVVLDVYGILVNEVVNAHRQGAVINDGRAFSVLDFAV